MPEVQESVLEHAAPEANQTPRLAGRLTDGDYRENWKSVNPTPTSIKHGALGETTISFDGSLFAAFAKNNPDAVFHVEERGYSYPISVPLYWNSRPDGIQT